MKKYRGLVKPSEKVLVIKIRKKTNDSTEKSTNLLHISKVQNVFRLKFVFSKLMIN